MKRQKSNNDTVDSLPEIEELLEEFFSDFPNAEEIDELLWRMFFHATLYDIQKNGAAAYMEDYGNLHAGIKKLINGLRRHANAIPN